LTDNLLLIRSFLRRSRICIVSLDAVSIYILLDVASNVNRVLDSLGKHFLSWTLCAILTGEMVFLFFGKRLVELRKQRGLSREELAKTLNLSYWAIAKYETGERMPSPDILSRLADFFRVSIDYLVGRTDDPAAGQPLNKATYENTDPPSVPSWVYKLPPDMQKFVEEESKHGWPYLRLARGLKMKDLSPAELEAIVETWMDAKRRYEKEFGGGKKEREK